MNTISLVSSISYNTPQFFALKIEELASGEKPLIDWAHWIIHKPESDETKAHIHFVCKPSRRIDTNWLRKQFIEQVSPEAVQALLKERGNITPNDIKPLGVLPFNKTNSIEDWLLYAIHDVKYLLKKGESREHHYERSDVQSTEPDFLAEQWRGVVDPLSSIANRVIELRAIGNTFGEILQTGMVPPNMVFMMKQVYEDVPDGVSRNGRKGHLPDSSFL